MELRNLATLERCKLLRHITFTVLAQNFAELASTGALQVLTPEEVESLLIDYVATVPIESSKLSFLLGWAAARDAAARDSELTSLLHTLDWERIRGEAIADLFSAAGFPTTSNAFQ